MSRTQEQLLQTFCNRELLLPMCNELLDKLAEKAKQVNKEREAEKLAEQTDGATLQQIDGETTEESKLTQTTVAISYAWPLLAEESLQERVLRLAEDLGRVGVQVYLDLLTCNSSTNFENESLEWIRNCDTALLIGSPSYSARAKDSSTLTSKETAELAAKKARNPEGIIPILMDGDFFAAFPPGYSNVVGCDFRNLLLYTLQLPVLVAKILNIHQNEDARSWLRAYDRESTRLLREAPLDDMDSVRERFLQENKYWTSRVVESRSKFSYPQLALLDGQVTVRDKMINTYGEFVISKIGELPIIPEDITPDANSLEQRLNDFLQGSQRVLLLQSPKGAGKSNCCQYLAMKAWQQRQWVPIFVSLDPLQSMSRHSLVDGALVSHGLDTDTIKQAQLTRQFLIIVEGLERCNVKVSANLTKDLQWPGKVVFACRTNFPSFSQFFSPESENNLAEPDETYSISFTSVDADEFEEIGPMPEQPTISSHDAAVARDRWQKAIREVSRRRSIKAMVDRYAQLMNDGFLLLQQDTVRVAMQRFLSEIGRMEANLRAYQKTEFQHKDSSEDDIDVPELQLLAKTASARIFARKAFISYAWPPSGAERTRLQSRLLQIVQDLADANIDVTLDILRLRLGMDTVAFMTNAIHDSDAVLWIGTPDLPSRIQFNEDCSPANIATLEFSLIQEKAKSSANSIQAIFFSGETVEKAFPPDKDLITNLSDFRNEHKYCHILPLLAATILGVSHTNLFQKRYSQYLLDTQALESNFTEDAIFKRLKVNHEERKEQQKLTEARLKQLVDATPEQFRFQQITTAKPQDNAETQSNKTVQFDSLMMSLRTLEPAYSPFELELLLSECAKLLLKKAKQVESTESPDIVKAFYQVVLSIGGDAIIPDARQHAKNFITKVNQTQEEAKKKEVEENMEKVKNELERIQTLSTNIGKEAEELQNQKNILEEEHNRLNAQKEELARREKDVVVFEEKRKDWESRLEEVRAQGTEESHTLLDSVLAKKDELAELRADWQRKAAQAEEARQKFEKSEVEFKSTEKTLKQHIKEVEQKGLQQDRIIFNDLLNATKHLSAFSLGTKKIKCFISYAWERDAKNVELQERLVKMKRDLRKAGIEVMLDIHNMEGDINTYMLEGIKESDRVILICTPKLKDRVGEKNATLNNLQKEFFAAIERQKQVPNFIIPIVLEGDRSTSIAPELPNILSLDFTKQEKYYENMVSLQPKGLIPMILGLHNNKVYSQLLQGYLARAQSLVIKE